MIAFPGSKINLGLVITHRMTNGYHSLESVFYPLAFSDILEVVTGSEPIDQFTYSGLPIPGPPENNLILKALNVVRNAYSIPPLDVHLHKVIPMGAGLGGGSADGAAMITLLNRKFELNIPFSEQLEMAQFLGADCPFFIDSQPAFAQGIGERLTPINKRLTGYYILIVLPSVHISTQEAFKAITPKNQNPDPRYIVENFAFEKWQNKLHNAFEVYAFKAFPELQTIKKKLYQNGALYASLTGSGSAIYGIFNKNPEGIQSNFNPYQVHSEALI